MRKSRGSLWKSIAVETENLFTITLSQAFAAKSGRNVRPYLPFQVLLYLLRSLAVLEGLQDEPISSILQCPADCLGFCFSSHPSDLGGKAFDFRVFDIKSHDVDIAP